MRKLSHLGALLALALPLLAAPAVPARADGPSPYASATVQAGPLTVKLSDVSLTPKEGYVYLLFDAYPYRQALKLDTPRPLPLEPVLKALVEKAVLTRWPRTRLVKSDIVEFSQRDDYGAPRWDTVTRLGKFQASVSGKRVSVRRVSGAGVVR